MHLTLFAAVFGCEDDSIRLKKVLDTLIQINARLILVMYYFR